MKTSIVCLFVLAVVRNHLSSSSFCVFRIGGVLVFVKDQGLSRVFGFPSFECFCVSSFDVFEFPSSKGDCTGFFVCERRGGLAAFWVVPLFLLCFGVFPLSLPLSLSLLHPTYYTKIYTLTRYTNIYTLTQQTNYTQLYLPLHQKHLGIVYKQKNSPK